MSARVSVWLVGFGPVRPEDLGVLPEPERERAAAMRRGADAFVALRAALRRVLGERIGCAPQEVPIVIGAKGKPLLGECDADLHFSITHGTGLGMIALAAGRPVGVDLERVVPGHAKAAAWALRMPSDTAPERVFAAWCEREAVAKASGCGLPAALRSDVPAVAGGWQTRALAVRSGWAAAVASPGADWSITYRGSWA